MMLMNVGITFATEMVKFGGANQETSMVCWFQSGLNHLSLSLGGHLVHSRLCLIRRSLSVSHEVHSATFIG